MTADETAIITEMMNLAVLVRSNLVNVFALLTAVQEMDEPVQGFLARLRGLAHVCKLTVKCSSASCVQNVSYSVPIIKHALVKGLWDGEVKEEILSQNPELDLDKNLAFIEAKELDKRSHTALSVSTPDSSQVNCVTTYQKKKKDGLQEKDSPHEVTDKCSYCGLGGHGVRPEVGIRNVQPGTKSARIVGARATIRENA